MHDIDEVLARLPAPPSEMQRTAMDAMINFLRGKLSSSPPLKVGRLRKEEQIWRKTFDLPHVEIRMLLMLAREMVEPGEAIRLPAIGSLRDFHPAVSPLDLKILRQALMADQLEQRYVGWRVQHAWNVPDRHAEAGEIVFLCLLRGGITLNRDLLALVSEPLSSLLPLHVPSDLTGTQATWLALPAEAVLALGTLMARHPDAGTLLGSGTLDIAGVRQLLESFLKLLPGDGPKPAAKSVIHAARARYRRDAPDWLVQAMTIVGQDVAALPATRYRLLIDLRLPGDANGIQQETPTTEPDAAVSTGVPVNDVLPACAAGKAYLTELIRCVRLQPNAKQVRLLLDGRLGGDSLPPDFLTTLLVKAVRARLDRKDPPKPQSIVRYLSALQCVPLVAGLESPFSQLSDGTVHADAEIWERIIEKAVDPAHRSDNRTPLELAKFHAYLVKLFPALAECDLDEIDGMQVRGRTRAVLVSHAEFDRAYARMVREEPGEISAALLAKVGFACGPRIRELSHARLRDLRIYDDRLILEIRHYPDRPLKTPGSRRDLPLHVLLSAEDQNQLRRHAAALAQLGHDPKEIYLFGSLVEPRQPPSRERAVRIVHYLRAVTGDQRITFHTLRHSAASWLILQFLSHEYPAIAALPLPGVPAAWFAPEAVERRVFALVPDADLAPHGLLAGGWTSALARIFGHSSFATTLRHYFHLRALIQPLLLTKVLPCVHAKVIARLACQPVERMLDRVQRWRRGGEGNGRAATSDATAECWRDHEKAFAQTRRNSLLQTPMDGQDPVTPQARLATVAVPVALKLVTSGMSISDVGAVFGCGTEAVAGVVDACQSRQVEDGYLAGFTAPITPKTAKERARFSALAQRLDDLDVDVATKDAWRFMAVSGNRWFMAGQDDVRRVMSHLHRVLPPTGCVQIELISMLPDDQLKTPEERKRKWSTCIDDHWGTRLRVIPHAESAGHGWRYRPSPRGRGYMEEWVKIRVGHLPWPAEGKFFARSQGYSEALIAWRIRGNLRIPLADRANYLWVRDESNDSDHDTA